jgi:hypothetical protein
VIDEIEGGRPIALRQLGARRLLVIAVVLRRHHGPQDVVHLPQEIFVDTRLRRPMPAVIVAVRLRVSPELHVNLRGARSAVIFRPTTLQELPPGSAAMVNEILMADSCVAIVI